MRSSTRSLINALRVLDSEIQSDDGMANAVIAEAAQRLEEQQERIEALNRGNANAERILCEAAGVGCGRDVLQWIVAAREKIKRLEEEIVNERSKYKLLADDARAVVKAWEKAKEAKP